MVESPPSTFLQQGALVQWKSPPAATVLECRHDVGQLGVLVGQSVSCGNMADEAGAKAVRGRHVHVSANTCVVLALLTAKLLSKFTGYSIPLPIM